MRTRTHARTQVMYTKFTEILDAVFTCKNLEKMPTVQARMHARTHAQSELGAQKVFTVKATTILADSNTGPTAWAGRARRVNLHAEVTVALRLPSSAPPFPRGRAEVRGLAANNRSSRGSGRPTRPRRL